MGKNTNIILAILVVVIIMAANYGFFYNILSNTLYKNHKREVESIANHIKSNVEQTRLGSKQFEDIIGQKLRSDSIAIQNALPKKLDEVNKEQLINLRNTLNLQDISLLKKTSDDIVIEKSTDPNELGMGTNKWGLWYDAFIELYNNKNVSIDWGQKLQNYWSGPYEVAASDTKTISKWGYYYDGSTNYISSPITGDKEYKEYQKSTGTEAIIKHVLDSYPGVIEITGINPATFGKKVSFETPKGELLPLVHRPYFFGTYNYINVDEDTIYIRKAINLKKSIVYETVYNNKQIEKTFIPIGTNILEEALGHESGDGENISLDSYVLCIVSDKALITADLKTEFQTLITIISIVSLISVLLLIIIIRLIGRARDKAVQQTSQTYTEEVNQMFLNIKGQRHDFLNHVNVIHSFIELGKLEELKGYTNLLLGEVNVVNDVIRIGQPEIAAIVQAKMVTAVNKKINFIHEFTNVGHLMTGIKSVDIVRIIGNLMDNAFDEIENLPQNKKWVNCKGWLEDKSFNFEITNPLAKMLTDVDRDKLLNPGYTTKSGEHSGIGLSITRSIIQKYRGDFNIITEENQITFLVSIPV